MRYDIVIIGGGAIGSSVAYYLRSHPRAPSVAVIERDPNQIELVRQFGCEVYPARCIRLPGNRYRLELEPAITLPRDEKGRLDVTATAQLLNDRVEAWVREYPDQWLWYHDRWNIKHTL